MLVETAIGESLAQAVAARDDALLRSWLTDDVRLRALIPAGLVEATGPDEVLALFESWFGGMHTVGLLESVCDVIADRLLVSYRLALGKRDRRWLCGQDAFCEVAEGRIASIDLVCSGFLEVTEGRPGRPE